MELDFEVVKYNVMQYEWWDFWSRLTKGYESIITEKSWKIIWWFSNTFL